MLHTIKNEELIISISEKGAELQSVKTKNGEEYLWQGDPKYWADRALNIFPFVARLTDNSYCLDGEKYPMGIHGFAWTSVFYVEEAKENEITFVLTDNAEIYQMYPRHFILKVCYRLESKCLHVTYTVKNRDNTTMYFGIGGHPGFNVPLSSDEVFEDYYLEFSQKCSPDRVGFTSQLFLSGFDEPYPLEDGKYLPLKHGLFDEDAVILKNMAREVALRSLKSGKGVKVTYPDMPYLGIWHAPKTDAPYVCIEPWSSLPSRQDVVEELSCKSDLIRLNAGDTYTSTWSITIL